MQAVILAAGKSSRFLPFNTNHKSTFTLMGKPIIVHTLESLEKIGIKEVIVVVSKQSPLPSLIRQYKLKLKISFVEQPTSDGMGNALLVSKDAIKGDFFLLHAHHVDVEYFAKDLIKKQKEVKGGVVILAKSTDKPKRYGIVKIKNDRVLELTEKPISSNADIHLRVIGIYLLNKDFLITLSKIPQEHYHFEKALSQYAKKNSVYAVVTTKKDITLKYAWELLNLKDYLLQKVTRHISKKARIEKGANIIGDVFIGDGAVVMEQATIKGPAYIGNNAYIGSNTILRNGVVVEKDSVVGAYMELKNSILGVLSTTHSGFIGDSVIGSNCKIAAFFCSGNLRLDREMVKVSVGNEKVDSHLKYLGVLMGDRVRVGLRVSTMPGIIIGSNSIIGPSTTIVKNVDENIRYYTKFQEVVETPATYGLAPGQKNLILFDLDNTLFDAHTFRSNLFEEMSKTLNNGVKSQALYEKCQELTDKLIKKYGFFDPEDFIRVFLSEIKMPHKKDALLKVVFDKKLSSKHVYKEVLQNLELLSKVAHIGILSQGLHNFQSAKLASIQHLFHPEKIHFELDKRAQMDKIFAAYKDYQIYFVDDLLIMLDAAKKAHPGIITIWMKRRHKNKTREDSINEELLDFVPDEVVTDVREIISIVKNL